MIKKAITFILLVLPVLGFSQKFRAGVGIVNEEIFSISEITTPDGLIISEGNKFPTSIESFYFGYVYAFSGRLEANVGIQNTYNGISLFVRVPVPYDFPDPYVLKIMYIRNRNFEFPLELSYAFFKKGKFEGKIRGGIVPVWTRNNPNRFDEVPNGLSWSQEVVDALNAAETIPKSFYMNYQYGLGFSYGRFELSLFQSANLSRSISNGYTLNGTTYPFDRRIRSTRIGLFYSFGLKKDKE